jgi:hypothetical protein
MYYDDNFGHWEDMDDEDNIAFYNQVQSESVEKECCDCGRSVRLRPDYCRCNSCADLMESGRGY